MGIFDVNGVLWQYQLRPIGAKHTSSGIDALIQALIDGSADDGYFDAFESVSGYPDPSTDTLLATTRLASPAAPIGNLVSPSDIVLNFTDDEPEILATSAIDVFKYFRVTASDHTTVIAWGSIGTSSDDFDPDLIVNTMDWRASNTLTLAGVVHARSVAETLTGYTVTLSTATPPAGTAYTATAQAKAGASDLHRIGLTLTPSYVKVSGTGGGSVTESSVITNRYGLSETIHVTAGADPTTEKVHVTDGTFTGNSSDAVVQPALSFTLINHTKAGSTGASTGATTANIDTTGADLIIIALSVGSPTYSISDNKGNTYTALTNVFNTPGLQMYYCQAPTVGSGHNFSVADTGGYGSIAVAAFSGSIASPFDQENAAIDVMQAGSVTPGFDNELVVAALAWDSIGSPVSIDSGFTITDTNDFLNSQHYAVSLAYDVQTTATETNPTWSYSGSGNTAVKIATFRSV